MIVCTSVSRLAHKTAGPSLVPFPSSGRCFFARALPALGHLGDTHPHITGTRAVIQGEQVDLTELTSSHQLSQNDAQTHSQGTSRRQALSSSPSALPLSLAGNGYYERRFKTGGRRAKRPLVVPAASAPRTFQSGDLIVHAIRSVTPRSLRHTPMVDVTGVRTSYLDASERDERYLQTVDAAIHTMHLHDGAEVPALQRGDVAVGQLDILAAWCDPASQSLTLRPVENAQVALLGRRGPLTFRQLEEGLQMARRLAEAYTHPRGPQWRLRPVRAADGHVFAFRLM